MPPDRGSPFLGASVCLYRAPEDWSQGRADFHRRIQDQTAGTSLAAHRTRHGANRIRAAGILAGRRLLDDPGRHRHPVGGFVASAQIPPQCHSEVRLLAASALAISGAAFWLWRAARWKAYLSCWRPRPESNRGTRICSPLRNHSATRPGGLIGDAILLNNT